MPKRVQTSVELNGINMIKFKDINYPRRKEKEIIINDMETIYNSINEAAIKNNVSASAIYNCLYGKSKTCGGYEWIKIKDMIILN